MGVTVLPGERVMVVSFSRPLAAVEVALRVRTPLLMKAGVKLPEL